MVYGVMSKEPFFITRYIIRAESRSPSLRRPGSALQAVAPSRNSYTDSCSAANDLCYASAIVLLLPVSWQGVSSTRLLTPYLLFSLSRAHASV